ncbi:hypothetical protein TRVL_04604 [Trypanosoma vivax]|nr:hypothetical protein TRVL_04604 [Trypanosoma vivax]
MLTSGTLLSLCMRASALVNAGSSSPAPPSTSTVRYTSSISAALAVLAGIGTRNAQFRLCASQCIQQLAIVLERVPVGAPLPNEVVSDVLRVVKRGCSASINDTIISSICMNNLLHSIDDRIVGPQFASWKPQAVIAALYSLAKAQHTEPLRMIGSLLCCAKEHLHHLDERGTTRLLWCMAKFGQEKTFPTLWKRTCNRLLHFFSKLQPSSRALLMEGLLLVPDCECDAQQQLTCLLYDGYQRSRVNNTHSGEEDTPAVTTSAAIRDDYSVLKGKLLSHVHLLPVDAILSMLRRTCNSSTFPTAQLPITGRLVSDGNASSATNMEIVDYSLKHLLYRTLQPSECRELLEIISSLELSELTRLLQTHIVKCISSMCTETQRVTEHRQMLESICIAIAMEYEQKQNASEEVLRLLTSLCVSCHLTRYEALERYNGDLAGALSVALDVLAISGKPLVVGQNDALALTSLTKLVEEFPFSWEKGGAVSVNECAAGICAVCRLLCKPLLYRFLNRGVTTPLSITIEGHVASVGNGRDISLKSGGRHTFSLLERCKQSLGRVAGSIPTSSVFDIWRQGGRVLSVTHSVIAQNGNEPRAILESIMATLLNYAEEHPSQFSLCEVSQFVGGEPQFVPVDAFELFLRCVANERKNVLPKHLDQVVATIEYSRAYANVLRLERLLILLFLRPLGHESSLGHSAPFTIHQLVRLFTCCAYVPLAVGASMQATLLERIVTSCGLSTEIEELIVAASLLQQLEPGPVKSALVSTLTRQGICLNPKNAKDVQKALLLVYLYKAGVQVDGDLLQSLRRKC